MTNTTQPQVEMCQNPNARLYHVRHALTDTAILLDREQYHTATGIAEIILRIPGISGCYISSYQLHAYKARMYSWDEIEPHILEALRAFTEPRP